MFTNSNCPRCPIIGQTEVSGAEGRTKFARWRIDSGFYFPPRAKDEDDGQGDEDGEEDIADDDGDLNTDL